MLAAALILAEIGPVLGRPHVDTLAGSQYPNMKELRFDADDGVWRVAFAFDPERKAILLVAGDKAGVAQKRFYKALIAKARLHSPASLIQEAAEVFSRAALSAEGTEGQTAFLAKRKANWMPQ